jgi:low temperature requirement protein LtrA
MSNMSSALKELWQLPKLRTTKKERHATWLELFYDLVFVVAIAELGHLLSKDFSPRGIFNFIFLFIPIWYEWMHHTFYADRFDSDNFAHRFLTIVQMIGVAGIAASVHGALGDFSQVFAGSFVLVKFCLVLLYWRSGHIDSAKPLSRRFSGTFGAAAALWLLSIFVPISARFWVWGFAIFLEFYVSFHKSTRKIYGELPHSESHLVERIGLFTIIVLGESVAGIVGGMADAEFEITATVVAVFGLLLAFGYWWIYFENLDGSALKGLGGWPPVYWLYVHLPLTMSLTAVGISIEHLTAEGSHALETSLVWLSSGALAISYFSIAVTHFVISRYKPETLNPKKGQLRVVSGVLVLVIGATFAQNGGKPIALAGLFVLVTLVQVFIELLFLKEDPGSSTITEPSS